MTNVTIVLLRHNRHALQALAQPVGESGREIAIDQFVLAVTATAREAEEPPY